MYVIKTHENLYRNTDLLSKQAQNIWSTIKQKKTNLNTGETTVTNVGEGQSEEHCDQLQRHVQTNNRYCL